MSRFQPEKTRQMPFPSTAHRRSLPLDQGSISYLEWVNSGPAFYFAHANGFNAQTYCELLSPLAEGSHVLASDARGHGQTELPAEPGMAKGWTILRDDLIGVLETLNLGPMVLGGHSLGAVVSLMVATTRPDLVRGLVLVEPVLVPGDTPDRNNPGPALMEMTQRRREKFLSFDDVLNAYRGRGAFESWPEQVLIDYLQSGLKTEPDCVRLACAPRWEADIYGGSVIGAANLGASVRCPITLIYGDTNSTTPAGEAQILAQDANARLVKVTGASHFLPMERPDVVREEIMRMMEC
jgi:pimeloyl-ACP methyl ester carboxylesterase